MISILRSQSDLLTYFRPYSNCAAPGIALTRLSRFPPFKALTRLPPNTGTIPSALLKLSDLNQLWLNNNTLTGTITPDLMSRLDSLAALRLGGNALVGCIPADLARKCGDGTLDCASAESIDEPPYYRLTEAGVGDQACGVLKRCGEPPAEAACASP